jgi:hypothetical protein
MRYLAALRPLRFLCGLCHKAGSKNQLLRLAAVSPVEVFHEISRAAGPSQQTTKSDRLPYDLIPGVN